MGPEVMIGTYPRLNLDQLHLSIHYTLTTLWILKGLRLIDKYTYLYKEQLVCAKIIVPMKAPLI